MTTSASSLRQRFDQLHGSGSFLMPNAWDVGSALILESLGFDAIATTSSGFAASLGRHDQNVTLAELAVHVAAICAVIEIPLSVDAEFGYAGDLGGLDWTVRQLAATGVAGLSIEDYQPGRGLVGKEEAADRVGRTVAAAREVGMIVTARAENHLYGVNELDDTLARLKAYRAAGADVLYAPGLTRLADISRVVTEVGGPVNVLILPNGPTVSELSAAGVRRMSTGGALAFAAYGALARGARELLEQGTSTYTSGALTGAERLNAFGRD